MPRKCPKCQIEFDFIERDASYISLHRIRYLPHRDVRITEEVSKEDYHSLLAAGVIDYPANRFVFCPVCTKLLHTESDIAAITAEMLEDAVRAGALDPPTTREEQESMLEEMENTLYEDPVNFGINMPIIQPDCWRYYSEPDTCDSCESPFKDDDLVWVVKAVDLLNGEPIDEERPSKTYDSDCSFCCTDCGSMINNVWG